MGDEYALVLKELGSPLINSAANLALKAVAVHLIFSALLKIFALIKVQLFYKVSALWNESLVHEVLYIYPNI